MKRYYNKKQLAAELGVAVQAIDNWRKQGILPYIKMGHTTNSRVLFDMQDVELFLERRKYNKNHTTYNQSLTRSGGFQPTVNPDPSDSAPLEPYIEEDYDRPPDIY